eukprot:7469-Eustigmatos_ZCMA.PRE.1
MEDVADPDNAVEHGSKAMYSSLPWYQSNPCYTRAQLLRRRAQLSTKVRLLPFLHEYTRADHQDP